MATQSIRPHIFLLIVNLFYGAGFTVSKLVMPEYIGPFGFILIRVTVATLLFFTLHYFWFNERVEKKDFVRLAICGLLGVIINQEMFFMGLSITTPINASLIMIMTPILVFVISFLLAQENITWQKIAGLALGAGGALIILAGKNFTFSGKTVLGDFFILINAISYAAYIVTVRPLMKKYHPLTVIKWVFFLGLGPVFILGIRQFSQIQWGAFSVQTWAAVIFIVVCVTFLAYLLNIMALKEVHSSVVGAYIYLQPIIASVIAVALGKDRITHEKLISGALIFTGVYLVSFAGNIRVFNRPEEEPDTDDMLME